MNGKHSIQFKNRPHFYKNRPHFYFYLIPLLTISCTAKDATSSA